MIYTTNLHIRGANHRLIKGRWDLSSKSMSQRVQIFPKLKFMLQHSPENPKELWVTKLNIDQSMLNSIQAYKIDNNIQRSSSRNGLDHRLHQVLVSQNKASRQDKWMTCHKTIQLIKTNTPTGKTLLQIIQRPCQPISQHLQVLQHCPPTDRLNSPHSSILDRQLSSIKISRPGTSQYEEIQKTIEKDHNNTETNMSSLELQGHQLWWPVANMMPKTEIISINKPPEWWTKSNCKGTSKHNTIVTCNIGSNSSTISPSSINSRLTGSLIEVVVSTPRPHTEERYNNRCNQIDWVIPLVPSERAPKNTCIRCNLMLTTLWK